MVSLLWGFLISLMVLNYVESIVLLSFCLPVFIAYMYKVNVTLSSYLYMINGIGNLLCFLTLFLLMLILLQTGKGNKYSYYFYLMSLGVLLLLCFCANNILLFYVYFESSLVPILLMILGWGYQPERLQAGMYMVMYTVAGSFPLLLLFLNLYYWNGSSDYYLLRSFGWFSSSGWVFVGLLAFLIKLPVYSMHVWLPKAHVEAPLGGSMVLAGILLKLGGYGLYFYNQLITSSDSLLYYLIMSLSLWGGVIAGLLCLCQSDIKSMIAYSSIVHMSIVVTGVLSSISYGLVSALITMIAHGWASSMLFSLAYCTYLKVGSRSFLYSKGLLKLYPVLSLGWFLVLSTNMSVPPTLNFVGEMMFIPVASFFNFYFLMVFLVIMFLSVVYNMMLYIKVNHGAVSSYLGMSVSSLNSCELLVLFGHLVPLLLLIKGEIFLLFTVFCN
uniref:NADH-ubiquinone oxidoreductase chain 4 n=2 Tax=Polygyridae TaxID=56129 RepID=A0A1J0MRP7_9EUPU|nr:NADH dehydrogenase subunit 4 [Polygyra cereolus]YP_009328194.1 NADH dehydrogenase subunit 4 [Praticolella mexicana]APD28035.1 NADH dehydrogenase subunit 4 [Praticolella mexicana]APD28048.1 NADH dehydrogenase subunit 4 [Polygyra cereolus]